MEEKKSPRVSINYSDVVQYKLPVYNARSKDKLVTYYVLDPDSLASGCPKLRRMRKKFCGIKDKKTRDFEAARFCSEITKKLQEGWNPLLIENEQKTFTELDTVFKRYVIYIEKNRKEKTIAPHTYISYNNKIQVLSAYIKKYNPIRYVYQLNTSFSNEFLDYVFYEREVNACTRNDYLRWLSTFCNWCLQHGYMTTNPCSSIKSLRQNDKFRKCLTHEDMKKLKEYLEYRNVPFLIACQFAYYTFIRPNEMINIKIGDISIEEQSIFVDHGFSKNHKDAKVAIPHVLLESLQKHGLLNYPPDYYLFGHELVPGLEQCTTTIFRNHWKKVRKALGWGKEYQFYSLKDTGITDCIVQHGLVVARDQARHQSIKTTNRYVLKEQMKPHEELKDYEGFL